MACPHCAATLTTGRTKRTQLGYRSFARRAPGSACRRQFNERTGTPYNDLEFPTDIVLLVVLWRVRYKLSLRDLAELFLPRGCAFTHEAVRAWEARFAPLVADKLRAKRTGQAGRSWYVDEPYNKITGRWCYLYRAIDRDGNLVDGRLSETGDMDGAKQFFTQAVAVVGHAPERVTTDGHASYPRAIRETLGEEIAHRTNPYLNNRLEQDHRGIKPRYYPMRGFGTVDAAGRFCAQGAPAFDEQRQSLPHANGTARTCPSVSRATTGVLRPLDGPDGRVDGCLITDEVGARSVRHVVVDSSVLNSDATLSLGHGTSHVISASRTAGSLLDASAEPSRA